MAAGSGDETAAVVLTDEEIVTQFCLQFFLRQYIQLLCFHCFHLLLLVCYMLNHKDCTCAIYKKFQIIWSYVPKGFIGCFLLACS